MKEKVLVRGGGDLATGTIWTLQRCGYRVLVSEIAQPSAIRRSVSLCEAVYDGVASVEGVTARKIGNISEAQKIWDNGEVPVIVDPGMEEALQIRPDILVDAAIAKRNLGTKIDMAPLVVGLGPGFTAGVDVDVVIETNRGHDLGRILTQGTAQPNTGVPGQIAGYGKERVMHSENDGIFHAKARIGDVVGRGDILGYIGDTPLYASLDGVLRGLIRDGFAVPRRGFKVADIDPRIQERKNCFTISDKARALAGSVLTAIVMHTAADSDVSHI